ncbi:MAG: hypothetical protein ACI9SE_002839, partial [Neolewinella sp.]
LELGGKRHGLEAIALGYQLIVRPVLSRQSRD